MAFHISIASPFSPAQTLQSDSIEIAQEIEIETTPMMTDEILTSEMKKSKNVFLGELSPDISNSNSQSDTSSIIMTNVEYEDISEEEKDLDDSMDDEFTTELVSLLTPESTLIEEDSEFVTDNKFSSIKNNFFGSIQHGYSAFEPITGNGNRVSTIKWAPKKTENSVEKKVSAPVIDTSEVVSQPTCSGTSLEDDAEDEIVFLGEFRPPRVILPCFLPCCYNALDKVIPVRVWHQNRGQDTQASSIDKVPSGSIKNRLTLFPDPPETEWVTVSVFHLDPLDGILRYKCRNCDGVVEQKSYRSRFQLCTQEFQHQCPQCERKYFTKKQLKHHQYRHNERRLSCHYCDRRFLTKSELQNHINTHTRAKTFACPICSEVFAHSSRYYCHLKTYHKKYECQECFLKICGMKSCTR